MTNAIHATSTALHAVGVGVAIVAVTAAGVISMNPFDAPDGMMTASVERSSEDWCGRGDTMRDLDGLRDDDARQMWKWHRLMLGPGSDGGVGDVRSQMRDEWGDMQLDWEPWPMHNWMMEPSPIER